MRAKIALVTPFLLTGALLLGGARPNWQSQPLVPPSRALSAPVVQLAHPPEVEAHSAPKVTISGTVHNADETAAEHLRVRLVSDNGRIAAEIRTGPGGTFRFEGFHLRSYRLQVLARNGRPLAWENDGTFAAPSTGASSFVKHEIRLRQRLAGDATAAPASALVPAVAERKETSNAEIALATSESLAPQGEGTAHISGTVTAEDNSQPLADVNVRLHAATADLLPLQADRTDANGRYHFAQLEAGDYKLAFEPSSFGDSQAYLSEFHADQVSLEEANPIAVAAGETVVVDAGLTRGGTIEGVVTGGGNPLESITVGLYDAEDIRVDFDWTDETGSYQLQPLPAGEYRLAFEPSSFGAASAFFSEFYDNQPDLNSASVLALATGETLVADAELTRGGTIEGVVTGGANPLADVSVRLYDTEGNRVDFDWTDETGSYRLQPLSPGTYKVHFDPSSGVSSAFLPEYYDDRAQLELATDIAIAADETISANADLALGGVIRGTVTDEETGFPLGDVAVTAYGGHLRLHESATTDASGVYTLTGLATERYRLRFEPLASGSSAEFIAEYYADQERLDLADEIEVTAPQVVDNVDVQLARGAKVSGQIRSAGSGERVGDSLPDVHVSIYDLSGGLVDSTTTDAGGVYTLTRLVDGIYWLYAEPAPGGTSANFLPGHHLDPIAVTAPELTRNLDIVLDPGGQVAGRVSGEEDGLPLADIRVAFYDAVEAYFVQSVWTDAAGYYTSTGLHPGSYELQLEPSGFGDLASYLGAAVPAVVDGTTLVRGVDASLSLGGRITGTVTAQDSGLPLENLTVVAYNALGDEVAADYGPTNVVYSLAGLPTGEYRIRFEPRTNSPFSEASPYQPTFYNGRPDLDSADIVAVVAPETIGDISASLALGGRITGTVTASDGGAGLADVEVILYTADGQQRGSVLSDEATGAFELRGLASGEYRLHFKPRNSLYSSSRSKAYLPVYSGQAADLSSAEAVQISAPGAAVVHATLDQGGQITGQILDVATNAPAAGVSINVYSASTGDFLGRTDTDAEGGYLTGGLPSGSYWLEIARNQNLLGPIEVTAPNLVEDVNGSLLQQAAGGGVVAGRIVAQDTNQPLAGVRVELENCAVYESDRTDHLGVYHFDDLPGDSYALLMEPNARSPSAPYQLARVTIALKEDEQRIDRFVVKRGGRIAGTITAEDSGQPLAAVSVFVVNAEGNFVDSVYTDEVGEYLTVGLADGAYRLSVSDTSNRGYLRRWSGNRDEFEQAQLIAVVGPQIAPGNDVVLPRGGQIAGLITAADTGFPLDDVDVIVYDESGRQIERTEADAQGRYLTRGLPSGRYRLYFETEYHNETAPYVSIYHANKLNIATASEINVTAPAIVRDINAALQRGGQISGFVAAEHSGQPLEDVSIHVYDNAGNVVAFGNTNRVGMYTTNAVRSSTYRVRFAPENATCPPSMLYADQYYADRDDLETADAVAVQTGEVVREVDARLQILDDSVTATPTPSSPVGESPTATPTSNATVESPASTQLRLYLPLTH